MSELDRYDYQLPRELIAQEPLADRNDARLMVVNRRQQSIEHAYIRDLPRILRRGDCLISNDTRVVPARLLGERDATGGRWEGLFLEANADGFWRLLCKTRGKLRPGETVTLWDRDVRPVATLELIARQDAGVWLARPTRLSAYRPPASTLPPALQPAHSPSSESFELLEQIGRVPLPHYIRDGEMNDADRYSYQTVFAREPGAVAAPTAGLHFTHELLIELVGSGIQQCRVTLHVGMDTFRPITVEHLDQHPMHTEWGRIEQPAVDAIARCKAAGQRAVAIGTTSVRVLETAARESGILGSWSGQTDLFIRPPFPFRVVDALMTNFHLPRTTLIVLVHTFGGEELMRRAYQAAIEQRYRFYSYGDAMIIL